MSLAPPEQPVSAAETQMASAEVFACKKPEE